MGDNRSKEASVIILIGNAISGMREMQLAERFDDYISGLIDEELLEEKMEKYLSNEKLIMNSEGMTEESAVEATAETKEEAGLIDYDCGMQYSGGLEEVYMEIMGIYSTSYDEVCGELQRCIDSQDWKKYTVNIHALKSNSLSIGANSLADRCLKLEMAGKKIQNGEEVSEQIAYILDNHQPVMEKYMQVVKEAEAYIKDHQ